LLSRDAKIARAGGDRGSSDCHCAVCESSSLLVQDNTQEGIVDVDLAIVFDEARFPEFVHKEINP
jgi:hypothetical protein